VALSDLGLFKEPAHLVPPSIVRDKEGMVSFLTGSPVASIRYTLDGSEPGPGSTLYRGAFLLAGGGLVKARSFEGDNTASEVTTRELGLSKAGWRVIEPGGRGHYGFAVDEDERTVWSTLQKDTSAVAVFPQDISIDMGKSQTIKAFTYLPRQDKRTDGIADRYIFYTAGDGINWQKVAEGEFSNIKSNPIEQVVPLDHPVRARYFTFSVLHVVGGNGVVVAELGVR
jgi:alpha-L-fucosidase